jgi:hypothetical protein
MASTINMNNMKKFGVLNGVGCGSHRFDADPDPTFHFDLHHTPNFTQARKSEIF